LVSRDRSLPHLELLGDAGGDPHDGELNLVDSDLQQCRRRPLEPGDVIHRALAANEGAWSSAGERR
jgi:hypothetical protein